MQIQDFLTAVRGRLRKSILLEGWSRVLLVITLTALAVFILDRLAPLPAILRLFLLLGYAFIVFDTLYWRLFKPLRLDMSDHNVVDLMERRLPELNGRAFVALEGLPLVASDQEFLQQFLNDEAVQRIVPAPYMKQWFASSGAVCALLVLLLALHGDFFATAFERMLLPFGTSEWDRSTQIVGGLERDVVAEDESVVFVFKRTYGQLDPLYVAWTDQQGREGSKTFDSIASPWRQALQLPPGVYDFVVRSGDSKAVRCSGQVVARPQLAEVRVRIEPPAYAQLNEQNIDTFDVSVLPGSTLSFDIGLRMDQGRELAEMSVWHDKVEVNLEKGEDGSDVNNVHGRIRISQASTVLIKAADQNNIGMKPSPQFQIGVLSDNVPQIRLSGPRRSEQVTAVAHIALRIDASDDYGIAQSHIDMRHEPQRSAVVQDEGTGKKENNNNNDDNDNNNNNNEGGEIAEHGIFKQEYTIKSLEIIERHSLRIADYAAEGSRLVLVALAQDANDVTGPGIGRSNEIELLVVTEQELRRNLQKHIAEVRERVQQSRDALMPALASDEKVAQHARHAGSLAQKAQSDLKQVIRRWKENALPTEEARVLHRADAALRSEVQPQLLSAKVSSEAHKADKELAKVYRMLSDAVDNNDLPHELAGLIEQQKNLAKQSKEFVLKYMVKKMDAAAKNSQRALAERQQELSAQVRDWEQRLLDSRDARYTSARKTARAERPAHQLAAAAKDLASKSQRQESVGAQKSAVASMNKMYKQMQGTNESGEMVEQLAKLAQQQEELAKDVQAGLKGKEQRKEQRKLAELTKKLIEELKRKPNKSEKEKRAQQHMEGAQSSQKKSSQAMSQNKQNKAQTEASTAANLLRQAQKALEDKKEGKDKEEKEEIKIVELLKKMRSDQTEVVSDAIALNNKMDPTKKIGFRQRRLISALDADEKRMLRLLRNEAYPALKKAKQDIAIWGLKRVEKSIDLAHKHLAKPALGERGVELCKVVLREIDRLLQIVEKLPKPKKSEEAGGGEGEGGGSGPPFPPLAQLNLLAQGQELVMQYTMARYGNKLAADQGELASMIAQMLKTTRPGTRPEILLRRVSQAMNGADQRLKQEDMGVHTQHQQRLAVLALQQMMREAKSKKGGKGKPPKDKPRDGDKQERADKGSPSGSSGGSSQSTSAGASQGQGRAGKLSKEIKAITEQYGADWLMKLPPKVRGPLMEVNLQELPPGALELYRRYLRNLEDIKE